MRRLAALLPFLVAVACATSKEGNRGAPCDRSSECAPGLFCVDRLCTDDLSRLDGGVVPSFDTGSADAAMDGADGMGAEVDPDAPPPMDTGMPPPDTKPPPDTLVPPMDTFVPPMDTFVPPPDTTVVDTAVD